MKKTVKIILPLLLMAMMSLPVSAQNTNAAGNSQYVIKTGKILEVTEVTEGVLTTMVRIQSNNDEWVFNIIDTTPVYRSSTMNKADRLSLVAGEVITAFYYADTPVTLSLPPQVSPNAVVIHDSNTHNTAINVFDSTGLAVDSSLKLNITNDTIVVDINGKSLAQDSANNAYLLVFYTNTTKSIPPQASPNKIVVLGHPENMDTITAVGSAAEEDEGAAEEELEAGQATEPGETAEPEAGQAAEPEPDQREVLMAALEQQGVHVENNVKYVMLREMARLLEYEIHWNETDRTVTLTRENATFQIFIGKTHIEGFPAASLRNPPILLNGRTYVEEGFVDIMIGV